MIQYFINMTQLTSDTIYRDLKQKGLELTPSAKITIPDPQPIKTGIIKKLSSIVRKPAGQQKDNPTQLIQIMCSAFLAIRKNTIFIYKYTFQEQNKRIEISHEGTLSFPYNVDEIYICPSRYIQDRDFPMIVTSKNGYSYLNYDLKDNSIVQRCVFRGVDIRGIGWINDRECLVYDDVEVIHYVVNQGILKEKSRHLSNLIIPSNQKLKKMWIIGTTIDQHQDSVVPTFYCTIAKTDDEEQAPPLKLRVKQFTRTLDADIINSPKPDYLIQTKNLCYKEDFKIISVGQYFCVQLTTEVLIIKKKFQKYMLLDNMMQLMPEYHIKLNKKGLVVSIGEKLLELNCILFSDPKCGKRVCDVIEFPAELTGYHKYFKEVWPILISKEYTLIFVFLNENEVTLSGLVKLEPMTKMLALAKRDNKQNLDIIQQMAQNLGIPRKDFYLKLWSTSKKQNADIYKYLIPCKDADSIKKQLKSTLRTRTIQVTQMIKILQNGVLKINLQNLRQNLNQKNLRQYLKTHFLAKKLYLNHMNYPLDHRIFEKIYSSSILTTFCDIVQQQLDPVKPKYDPLHMNFNLQPQKQQKTLEIVFQKFKIVILEDYKSFLISFLSHFPKKIVQVLDNFTFLLPNHPFQIQVQKPSATNQPVLKDPKKNGTAQQIWFETVKVEQWLEQATKQKILKQLFNDFQTSKITETIDQFNNSQYGRENKRWKHGLIVANLDQYAKKLKTLSGVQLYLDVCQFANELSVANDGDPTISNKILQILQKKNGLCNPQLHICKLYSNMHYFMLKHKIIPKNKLQISYLMSLKPQNLVAVFFLQNKQRKQHIFDKFKNLFQDKNQFHTILSKFVQSQDCSRIQLEILMKQFNIKGEQFQQRNQEILDILITGVCMKVEIREGLLLIESQEGSNSEIDNIRLSKNLALKINRIQKLKLCRCIFERFGLQKMTYKELLDLENDNQIFRLILTKYFQLRDNEQRTQQLTIVIQNEEINLQNPRNILTVLVYLQQNVYYLAKTFDILIIFGLELVLWKQFDVIRGLVNDANAIQTLGVNRNEYVQDLTLNALDIIYLDPQIIYQQQTKHQILQILHIDTQDSPLKTRELAKLQLVNIFTEWGLEVHPSDIHTICFEWKDQNRIQFMQDLINNYIDKLNFNTFYQVYRLLEITDKQCVDVNHLNKEYVKFCQFFGRKLIERGRYAEAADVIAFLMSIEDQQVDYCMLAETYIQNIVNLYPEDRETGRKLIQLFAQSYGTAHESNISSLMETCFGSTETVLKIWQPYRTSHILISYKYLYEEPKKFNCQIPIDSLWQISEKQAKDVSEVYYNFFFLTMGLTNPKVGFNKLVGISYNLQKVSSILTGDLDNLFDKDESLWYVNYPLIQGQFLYEGMLSQAANSLGLVLQKDKQGKFDMIVSQLRNNKNENEKNQLLSNILTKLKVEILNRNKINIRKQRYRKKLKQLAEQSQKSKQLEQVQQQPVQVVDHPQIFLKWTDVAQKKSVIMSNSVLLMSQKQLIDQVYQLGLNTSKIREQRKPDKQQRLQKHILFTLFQKTKDKKDQITKLIKNRKYSILASLPINQVVEGIQKYFDEDSEVDYREVAEILGNANLGDAEKRDIFRLARIYLDYLPNSTRKTLFPLKFFLTPLPPYDTQQKKATLIYTQLSPNLQQLHKTNTMGDIRELANLIGSILTPNSIQYSALVYYQQLIYIGQSGVFNSSTALIAQQCINGMMASYPDIIGQRYREILDRMVDREMKVFVREIIVKLLSEKQNYCDIADAIRKQYDFRN